MKEYRINSKDPYEKASLHPYAVPLEEGKGDHVAVYRGFHEAILSGNHENASYCDGVQGRMELELANAIIFSNYMHSEVEFPLDRQRYAGLLEELRARSKG
jgi:hypothetical protein